MTRKLTILLVGFLMRASVDVQAAGTEPSTPVYITIQPNGTVGSEVGTGQVETATVVGTITTAGNATINVISYEVTLSAVATPVVVALALGDDANAVATKFRAALSANVPISSKFSVGGTGADVILTKVGAPFANDATLNIAYVNTTCAGLTAAPTSANTTPGSYPAGGTATGYVFTMSWVAGERHSNYTGLPSDDAFWYEGGGSASSFGNGGGVLDDVNLLIGGDWYAGAQKVLYRSADAASSVGPPPHTKSVDTLPNTSIAVQWMDPLNTTIGYQAPTTATLAMKGIGRFTYHNVIAYGSGQQGVTGIFSPNDPTGAGATTGTGVGFYTDWNTAGADTVGLMVSGYDDFARSPQVNTLPRRGYAQVVVPFPSQVETATVLGAGINQVETLTLSGVSIATRAQVETATIAGAITASGAGNATITVTGSLIVGSPLAVSVAVANSDSAATVAGKVRTALGLQTGITASYTVGGSSATVNLTKKTPFTFTDSTLNIASANGTCVGLTAAPTSANTTTGQAATGILNIIVTAAGMANSPKTVPVTIAASDTTAQQTVKVVAALVADADVNGFFVPTGTTTVILTARNFAANDVTMNVASSPVSITGPTAVASSVNTTAGNVLGAGLARVTLAGVAFGAGLDVDAAVTVGDTASVIATKLAAAMNLVSGVTDFYTASSSGANLILTKTAPPTYENDTTLNMAINNNTCTGLTPAPTSADSSPGGLGNGNNAFLERYIPGVLTNLPTVELTVTTDPAYVPKIAVLGDFDSDRDVDATDLTAAAAGYEGAGDIVPLKWYRKGDINADNDVDNADLGYVIGVFAAAPYTLPTSSGSATLTYNRLTGNVKLNAATAGGGKITSFQLQTSAATIDTGNYTPVMGGTFNGTYKNVTTSVIGDTDTTLAGVTGSAIDLGDVFPTGMDLTQLTAYLTTKVYTGASGSRQQQLALVISARAPGTILMFR